ncbi:hypothetical protein CSC70_08485 [Pseudoxanthomonas kalamensis DSM 18571]|uniref:hypothetical protein n=1 Tax=Pseudoxanthomonas kalamensis TaxID=289483 RepID=UPI0013914CDF|nr:hypothetical protein [Pseudoxanthomonas kalamensis]KAF1709732.1 hypothetical protein CSC70_08485 [Pseudoxanthomonas kalamensis DSM 18571]
MSAWMLYLSLAAASTATTVPTPPSPPQPDVHYEDVQAVAIGGSAQQAHELPEDIEAGELELLIVDAHTLRVLTWLAHDELDKVDIRDLRAWRSGDEIRIVVPLVARIDNPFAPRCCQAWTGLDLTLSGLEELPARVVLLRQQRRLDYVGEETLIPEMP